MREPNSLKNIVFNFGAQNWGGGVQKQNIRILMCVSLNVILPYFKCKYEIVLWEEGA